MSSEYDLAWEHNAQNDTDSGTSGLGGFLHSFLLSLYLQTTNLPFHKGKIQSKNYMALALNVFCALCHIPSAQLLIHASVADSVGHADDSPPQSANSASSLLFCPRALPKTKEMCSKGMQMLLGSEGS